MTIIDLVQRDPKGSNHYVKVKSFEYTLYICTQTQWYWSFWLHIIHIHISVKPSMSRQRYQWLKSKQAFNVGKVLGKIDFNHPTIRLTNTSFKRH